MKTKAKRQSKPTTSRKPGRRSWFSVQTAENIRNIASQLANSCGEAANMADAMDACGVKEVEVKGAHAAVDAMFRLSRYTFHLHQKQRSLPGGGEQVKPKAVAYKNANLSVDLFFQIEIDGTTRTLKQVAMNERELYRFSNYYGREGKRMIVVKATVELPYKLEVPAPTVRATVRESVTEHRPRPHATKREAV